MDVCKYLYKNIISKLDINICTCVCCFPLFTGFIQFDVSLVLMFITKFLVFIN